MSSPSLWKNISLMNKDHIIDFLESYIKHLEAYAACLRKEDGEGLERFMEQARALRSSIDGR